MALERGQETAVRRAEKLLPEEQSLPDMAAALRQIIAIMDRDKQELRDGLASRIQDDILPVLGRMARENSAEIRKTYCHLLEDLLVGLTEGGSRELDADLLRLTPTELTVCQYIKANRSTSEVADLMRLSLETVQTHRKNIRRKLGLVRQRISLQSYLRAKRNL